MLNFQMFRLLGFPRKTFFNNRNLISLLPSNSKRLLSNRDGLPLTYFKTNYGGPREVLQSSLGISSIFRARKVKSIYKEIVVQSRGIKRSNTWSEYNKHYRRSGWNQLKGPAIFTIIFCMGTTIAMPYIFNYTPFESFKRSPYALVYSLIAVNGAVFLMWKAPQFSRLLTRYGLLTKDSIYSNWSLLGAAFSHQSLGHVLVNMFVLQSFGTSLCAMVGVANFATMYLNSAVISSFISLMIPVLMRSSLASASLGASGAVFAVLGTFSYLIPKAPVALFFVPVPGGAWLLFLGSVAYNVAGIALRWGRYDYAAHIGGSIAGIAYGWWYNQKRKERVNRRRVYAY